MAEWEWRPLTLGEILDRTFTLYRKNFLLFLGITAIPQLLTLGVNILQVMTTKFPAAVSQQHEFQMRTARSGMLAFGLIGGLVFLVVFVLVYLMTQGATIYAVSDLYLGRPATIGGSLKKMWGHLADLFGVTLLNGLAVLAATVFFIIPGIYVACRLLICVPVALLEEAGARSSLERSWELTRGNAGRSFLIYVLYFAMFYGISLVFVLPSTMMLAFAAKDPSMRMLSLVLMQVGSFAATVLVGPFLLIATAVFYYDLRVTKEAFDLQMLLNPGEISPVPAGSSVPKMFG